MLSNRATRGAATLLFIALSLALVPAPTEAANSIIAKDRTNRKFADRAVTARDREAIALVQARLMELATSKTPQSIILTSRGGAAEGTYAAIEIRLPLQYKVITKALTEADRLNGTEWDGEVYVHSVASRKSAQLYAHQYDLANLQWTPWSDKSNTRPGDSDDLSHIVWVDLMKLNGKWLGTGERTADSRFQSRATQGS